MNVVIGNHNYQYPISVSKNEIILSSAALSLGVYLFLIVFQPFGTYDYYNAHKYLLLIPYAAISFSVFTIGNLLLSRNIKQWTFSHEVSKQLLFLLVCALFNYWYSLCFINHSQFQFYTLGLMVIYTLAVGMPVCSIYFLVRYLNLKHKVIHEEELAVIETLPQSCRSHNQITLRPLTGENFTISKLDLLCVQSQGNYCMIFYSEKAVLKKELLRIPLKSLSEQLCDELIVRCHRSFIINTQKIKGIKGNAQGYKLSIENLPLTIPVSRNYIELIDKLR